MVYLKGRPFFGMLADKRFNHEILLDMWTISSKEKFKIGKTFTVHDRRIFKITASPQNFSEPKQAIWDDWDFYGSGLRKIHLWIFLRTVPYKSQSSQIACCGLE